MTTYNYNTEKIAVIPTDMMMKWTITLLVLRVTIISAFAVHRTCNAFLYIDIQQMICERVSTSSEDNSPFPTKEYALLYFLLHSPKPIVSLYTYLVITEHVFRVNQV